MNPNNDTLFLFSPALERFYIEHVYMNNEINRIKKLLVILLNFFSVCAFAQETNLNEMYFNVDRLESYQIVDGVRKLGIVSYFEGKIIVKQDKEEIKCTSIKTGEEYLKFEKYPDGSFKIRSGIFNSCIGIFDKSSFQKKDLNITLKDDKYVLIYYLSSLTENGIYSKYSSGTGIFIDNKTILTNYHVVKSYNKLTIEFQNKLINGKIIKFDEILDLALVKIDDSIILNKQHLNFANYNVEIGKTTFASGYPLVNTMGKELKITSGIISSTKGFNDDNRYMQTTSPIDPGNSGGPLIDEYGNIIGIISAKHSYGTNVGYALKIYPLLKELYVNNTTSNRTILTTQQIYNKAKNTICLIKCFSF